MTASCHPDADWKLLPPDPSTATLTSTVINPLTPDPLPSTLGAQLRHKHHSHHAYDLTPATTPLDGTNDSV